MGTDQPLAEAMRFSLRWDENDGTDAAPPTPWPNAVSQLARVSTYWLATVHPYGRPHVVPVLGVVVDDLPHVCAGGQTRKVRNLESDPRVTVTGTGDTCDLVVEGSAELVTGDDVYRVADAYAEKYGWQPQVRDGAFWADGAPTAGPPPYQVYRVVPEKAFCFPSEDQTVPTRWYFAAR